MDQKRKSGRVITRKQIIDFIGELVSISGNSTVDSIIFAVIGVISFLVAFGFIARAIPIIITPIVNYIGFPIIIIVVIALLATGEKKEKYIIGEITWTH